MKTRRRQQPQRPPPRRKNKIRVKPFPRMRGKVARRVSARREGRRAALIRKILRASRVFDGWPGACWWHRPIERNGRPAPPPLARITLGAPAARSISTNWLAAVSGRHASIRALHRTQPTPPRWSGPQASCAPTRTRPIVRPPQGGVKSQVHRHRIFACRVSRATPTDGDQRGAFFDR